MPGKELFDSVECHDLARVASASPSPKQYMREVLARAGEGSWRLLFDFCRQDDDEVAASFDTREKGYTAAMKRALLFVQETMDQPLSATLIKAFHEKATEGVKVDRLDAADGSRGQFRSSDVRFGLLPETTTHEGFVYILKKMQGENTNSVLARNDAILPDSCEFPSYDIINSVTLALYLEEVKSDSKVLRWQHLNPDEELTEDVLIERLAAILVDITRSGAGGYVLRSQQCSHLKFTRSADAGIDSCEALIAETVEYKQEEGAVAAELNALVDLHVESYNKAMSVASTDDERLQVVATLCIDLEQVHPFLDANCRVFGMLVLNRLLLEKRFPPCILDDPNRLDGYSPAQMMDEIKKGMRNYSQSVNTKPGTRTPSPIKPGEVSRQGAECIHKRLQYVLSHGLLSKNNNTAAEAGVTADTTTCKT